MPMLLVSRSQIDIVAEKQEYFCPCKKSDDCSTVPDSKPFKIAHFVMGDIGRSTLTACPRVTKQIMEPHRPEAGWGGVRVGPTLH